MFRLAAAAAILLAATGAPAAQDSPRHVRPLDGPWEFRRDGEPESSWKPVSVPSVFQEYEGNDWHGVGWYRKQIDQLELAHSRRLLLHFDAAATYAEVWLNETRLGEHLGGWTPFRFDVTELLRKNRVGPHTIRVRLDERVGHNSQGFLPIIQPHFGGIWQSVRLIETPTSYIDDLSVMAIGDLNRHELDIRFDVAGVPRPVSGAIRYRRKSAAWSSPVPCRIAAGANAVRVPVADPAPWSPLSPQMYEVEIAVGDDRVVTHAGFRTIETKSSQLLLHGQPLVVRGVLNWGYYPPRLAPIPDRVRWKRDIELAKSMGFNCMKFCLWLPPREFFDLCDEMGMLVWQEYPTWHPKLDQKHRAELIREFTEFFQHDRNHPSVILRSLTCETGASADLGVVKDLYDLAKSMIPGCIVEDDSSWIEWNRINDFFDDHPYGNNHSWVKTLHRLRDHAARKGPKPLLLGEAIAADTWIDPKPLLRNVGKERSFWLPGFLDGNVQWLDRMRSLYGPGGLDRLEADSLRYAMLMRKFQIEMYRREVPDGGYVVSVLRDFPLAGMGLLGFDDQAKWKAADWSWHRDRIATLSTPGDLRSFPANLPMSATIHQGKEQIQRDDKLPSVAQPTRQELRHNDVSWPVWIMPPADALPDGIIRANRLSIELLDKLEAGARVLLQPDGERGSFPMRDHWFLRGGPYLPDHPLWSRVPRDMIVELQHFDLAGPVIPDLTHLEEIDPIVLLWDNHDIKYVRTHGLAFETSVGKGRLLVSALRHDASPAGRWLLAEFARHLATGPPPKNSLKPETIGRLREKLNEKKLDLTKETWRFRPDPRNAGVQGGWHKPDLQLDDAWSPIRVGKHWEAQGWPNLDGWAWYRLDVTIPKDWPGKPIYLSFEGVDDHYEAYVNGKLVGSGGDPQKKLTAFEERVSHDISAAIVPGERCSIAIRVLDWYGAGGIHRPVTLGTARLGTGDVLR